MSTVLERPTKAMVSIKFFGFVRQHPVHGPGTSAPAFDNFRNICRRQPPRADRGRANAGETVKYIDLAASGLAPSFLASPGVSWRLWMQHFAHFAILTGPAPPPPPPLFPAQTTRKLAMEVATTSQMLLGNIICECFLAKYSIWLCSGFSRCRHHLFFRTPLRAVAGTLAHLFGPTSAGCTAKGPVSSSTGCSVAVVKAHQPKLSSLDLNFTPTTYPPHGSSTFWARLYITSSTC
jgi:hypothetical protein